MPTFPVGDASFDAAVRRRSEVKADRVWDDAMRKAPRSFPPSPRWTPRPATGVPHLDLAPTIAALETAVGALGDFRERLERVDSAPYPWAAKERRPLPVGCEPPPKCDCGHLDTLHDATPGVGCTHRPYCFCVHPQGQRVPVRPVVLAVPSQADPALIVRSVR